MNDQEWKQYKVVTVYAFDRYSLFSIPRLNLFVSTVSINTYNHYIVIDDVHYKASLVEIVEVIVLDTVFNTYIDYKPKPCIYKLWIFAKGLLEIVRTQ